MKYIDKLKLVIEGLHDPHIFKAVLVVGSPASGKSELSNKLKDVYGLRIVDSDPALELMMRKSGLDLNMQNLTPDEHLRKDAIRDLAKQLRDKDLNIKVDNALGIVYPTVLNHDKIRGIKNNLESKGYETFLVFIDIPLGIALERNQQRHRVVPEDVVISKWKESHEEYTRVSGLFEDNTQIIDGTISPEEYNLSKISRFLNSPVRNSRAQNWINLQVELRKM
jgi:predicted kinase